MSITGRGPGACFRSMVGVLQTLESADQNANLGDSIGAGTDAIESKNIVVERLYGVALSKPSTVVARNDISEETAADAATAAADAATAAADAATAAADAATAATEATAAEEAAEATAMADAEMKATTGGEGKCSKCSECGAAVSAESDVSEEVTSKNLMDIRYITALSAFISAYQKGIDLKYNLGDWKTDYPDMEKYFRDWIVTTTSRRYTSLLENMNPSVIPPKYPIMYPSISPSRSSKEVLLRNEILWFGDDTFNLMSPNITQSTRFWR